MILQKLIKTLQATVVLDEAAPADLNGAPPAPGGPADGRIPQLAIDVMADLVESVPHLDLEHSRHAGR